jgi:hypothetical protein
MGRGRAMATTTTTTVVNSKGIVMEKTGENGMVKAKERPRKGHTMLLHQQEQREACHKVAENPTKRRGCN